MRRNVMSRVSSAEESLGWALRLERFFTLAFKSQRYAIVGSAFLAVVSVSLLGQIRSSVQKPDGEIAVFVGRNSLLRPTGYREWVFVGSSLGLGYGQTDSAKKYHNVYINPAAYREYTHTGKFPDGTVMVLEMLSAETESEGSYQKDIVGLEASVKDSNRFDGGWGFFDFTQAAGRLKADSEAMPEAAGCVSCHRGKAATDHVFTQFYPGLRKS
jgi:hypothetical protein